MTTQSTPRPWPQPTAHCLPEPPRPSCRSAQIEGVIAGPSSWADAEFIVRAVNRHEELLAALKQAVWIRGRGHQGPSQYHIDFDHWGHPPITVCAVCKVYDELAAIIAKLPSPRLKERRDDCET